MGDGDGAHDGQAEAGAGQAAGAVGAVEAVEDAGQVGVGDARHAVAHLHLETRHHHLDEGFSLLVELHRILREVGHGALHRGRAGPYNGVVGLDEDLPSGYADERGRPPSLLPYTARLRRAPRCPGPRPPGPPVRRPDRPVHGSHPSCQRSGRPSAAGAVRRRGSGAPRSPLATSVAYAVRAQRLGRAAAAALRTPQAAPASRRTPVPAGRPRPAPRREPSSPDGRSSPRTPPRRSTGPDARIRRASHQPSRPAATMTAPHREMSGFPAHEGPARTVAPAHRAQSARRGHGRTPDGLGLADLGRPGHRRRAAGRRCMEGPRPGHRSAARPGRGRRGHRLPGAPAVRGPR